MASDCRASNLATSQLEEMFEIPCWLAWISTSVNPNHRWIETSYLNFVQIFCSHMYQYMHELYKYDITWRKYKHIYIYIYQMDCVCQRYHKECSTRTRMIAIIVEKSPNSSHMYDHGFMDNTNRQAVKNLLNSQTSDASHTSWRQPFYKKAKDAELWFLSLNSGWINDWVNNGELVIWDAIAPIMTSF